MDEALDFNKISFVKYTQLLSPLIKESDFNCGNTDLDEFLREELEKHREQMVTQSTLIIYEEKKIIGYFSLQTDSIRLADEERSKFEAAGIPYKSFPSVKIGRLAVDERYAKKGLGKTILEVIIGIVRNSQENIASRFITVDSKKNEHALRFYRKNGFVENLIYNKDPKRETVSFRFDLYNPSKSKN
ncbi:MAG: GNAT family N-acetyltransferase [Candidatus Micrarchaeota archaeon]